MRSVMLMCGALLTLTAFTPAMAAPDDLKPVTKSREPLPEANARLLKVADSLFHDLRVESLDNGLKVYLMPVKGSPLVTTMLAYKVGSADEQKDQTGLSHYLEHLLFKGTDKLVPGDIDRITQRNGGRNNAYTSEDMTVYHFDFAADRWKQALEIEADRIRNTRIDEKHEFQPEKGSVISELKGGEDLPWDLESKEILPLLFPKDSPYSHPVIGQEKHVRGATAEIIKRHYDKWYHPNNASLVIAGGFDPDEALTLVKKLFGSIPKETLPPRNKAPEIPQRKALVRKEFSSKFDVARMLVGFNTIAVGEPEDYTLDVVDDLLATGKTSRLHRRLVQEERLCNEVSASNNAGRYPGWFGIQVEMLKGKDRVKAEKIVFEELARLAKEPVSAEELQRVRRRILASFIFSRESIHSLADLIARSVTYKDADYLKSYLDKVMKVSPADIQATAAKYLQRSQAVVVWSVPEDDVKPAEQGKATPPGTTTKMRKPLARQGGIGPLLRPLRQDSPALPGISLNDAKRTVLPNGLVLITLEHRRLPIVVADVHFKHVRLNEPVELSGVAALMGEMLEEGGAKHTGDEIAKLIEGSGGSLGFTSSGGSLKLLTPDTEMGFGLLFECLITPSFPEESLDRKRDQLLSVIADVETQPQNRSRMQLLSSIYGDHPFGRSAYGTRPVVQKLTRKQLQDFHATRMVPNEATVVVVGDFETAEMVKLVTKLTAKWKKVELPKLDIPTPPKEGKPGEFIISDATASQTHVYIGHLGVTRNDPDYYKLLVMDNILGTGPGFTDRLSANLRDRQGLAYTVNAQIAASSGEQPGTFIGYIGTFPDKYIWVREGFLKEIQRIRDTKPTAEEVEAAKLYLARSVPFRVANAEDIATQLLTAERFNLGFDFLETYRKSVEAVTAEDVQAVAKKHLDPKRLTISVVGPIDKAGKALVAPKDGGK